ncbi:MAG: Fic family protein [Porphyromonas sp.]|nr:Fic family protein [Porphyromonas sp.]
MDQFKAGYWVTQDQYKSFQPSLINRAWRITSMETIKLLSKADRMLGRLDMYSEHIPDINLFIGMHITKEATQSSKIEGTQTNMEEALMPEEVVPLDKRNEWEEVQNYITAMNEAVSSLEKLPFSSRLIRNTHKTLLAGVRGRDKQPGEFRRSQNWIGGSTIKDAVFVPPVHTSIHELMADIEKFAHSEENNLPDLLKIALIHYQFETVHPFLDGNGRVGRLMITLYLVSKGILKRPILYLSDYLERNRNSYYSKLTAVRQNNDLESWFNFFLSGVIETSEKGVRTFEQILQLKENQLARIGSLKSRAGNAKKVLDFLYKKPIIDVKTVSEITEVTVTTANSLVQDLVQLGIIKEATGAKRGRLYIMYDYIRLFEQ